MNEKKENVNKRKSISKKLRFEVFKRDMFTCQYCGRKAPDVVLQIDHLKPVSRGGKNDIMNLVTSCFDCNSGKRNTELDDNSIIVRKQRQAEILAQRIEQIEMIRDWHIELAQQQDAEVNAVNELFKKLTKNKFEISDSYKSKTVSTLIKKYGLPFVLDALQDGANSYGDPCRALNKLPGICVCKSNPDAERRAFLLNKMGKRFYRFDRSEAAMIVSQGHRFGGDDFMLEAEKLVYRLSGTWPSVKDVFYELAERYFL